MTTSDLDTEFDVAVDAARRAGRVQMERYERLERIVHKSEHDVVTEVDHLSEALIIDAIRRVFPSDAILAEESGHSSGATRPAAGPADGRGPRPAAGAMDGIAPRGPAPVSVPPHRLWIVDPLDGTVNYANGIPVFCVSIGLAIDGRPALGVVHDPARDEMFTARAGGGALLDGTPIRHPGKPRLSDAVVHLALPATGYARREARIRRAIRVARNMGSASLSLTYVANGRFDAMVQPGGLSLWDVAAAGLIATEAGATVTDAMGAPWFGVGRKPRSIGIVASAPDHHATLLAMLQ